MLGKGEERRLSANKILKILSGFRACLAAAAHKRDQNRLGKLDFSDYIGEVGRIDENAGVLTDV